MPIRRGHLHTLPQHWYLWPQTPFWVFNLISCGVIKSNGFGCWFGGRGGHTKSIYEPAKLMPPGLPHSLQWNKLTLNQKVLPSSASLSPTAGFEKLSILNIPENRRIAFTDFFLPLPSIVSIIGRTVTYSFTSGKKRSWGDLLRISLGRQCAFRSKHLYVGGFQTLYPITQVSLTCLPRALLNSAIWGIQSDNCTCRGWKGQRQMKADVNLTFTNLDYQKVLS